jgi:hypothetical protein
LTLWALATARTAQREQAAQSAALAAQTDALTERMVQVAQLRAELQTAATEAEAAAAQRQRNEQLGRALRAGQLAGAALLRREEAPTQALLYAVEALHVQQQAGEAPVPEAVQALRDLLTTLGGRPFAVAADDIAALSLSADGELIAAGDVAGGLHLWSAHGAAAPLLVAAHTGPVWGLAWLADGRLVSVGADGIAQLWRPQADSAAPQLTPAGSTRLSATDLYALDSAAGRPAGYRRRGRRRLSVGRRCAPRQSRSHSMRARSTWCALRPTAAPWPAAASMAKCSSGRQATAPQLR